MRRRLCTAVIGLLVLAGVGAVPASAADTPLIASPKVMTLNLYVGADLASFDPESILETIVATNYRERAVSIADEIGDRNPDLIGLQEVSDLSVTFSSDGTCDPNKLGPPVAGTPQDDYLDILLGALKAEGESYVVASEVTNAKVSLPFQIIPGVIACGNLTDRDVILARTETTRTWNPRSGNYAVNFTLPLPSEEHPTTFTRGWTMVDATVRGSTFTFANTHLEVEPDRKTGAGFCTAETAPIPCQIPQAQELAGVLAKTAHPTILVGDFNAAPGTTAYGIIAGAGFEDAWNIRLFNISQQENTCCQAERLLNVSSTLNQRIDIVFIRAAGDPVSLATVVFDQSWEKTPSGLWPTDHGSVVARLLYANP